MPPVVSKAALPPVALVLLSILSTQLGAAIAKPLFLELSPPGVVLLRLGFGALMLMLWKRPDWGRYSAQEYRLLVLFGLSIATMNGFFYGAIARIPIGIAVTVEFLGPLGVALLKSRRRLDLLWVALAGAGVLLLSPTPGSALDPLGLVYALIAAVGWGSYILLSAKAGESFVGTDILPIVMTVAAIALLPSGLITGGAALGSPRLWALCALVGFLSSVVTYTLEMAALKRMAVNVFGVLLSWEPAIASLLGFVILGEVLSGRSILAIGLVSLAAAGSAQGEVARV